MSRLLFVLTLLFCGLDNTPVALAESTSPILVANQQQLLLEQTRNAILFKKLKTLQSERRTLQPNQITQAILQRLALIIGVAEVDVENLRLGLKEVQQTAGLIQDDIHVAQQQWRQATTSLNIGYSQQIKQQHYLQEQQRLFSLQQMRVKTLQQTLDIAQKILLSSREWKRQLEIHYQLQSQIYKQQVLNQLAKRLQKEQRYWLSQIAKLNLQLQDKKAIGLIYNPNYVPVTLKAFCAQEYSNLIQVQLNIAKFTAKLAAIFNYNLTSDDLINLQKQLEALCNQLQKSSNLLQKKIDTLYHFLNWVAIGMKNKEISISSNPTLLEDLHTLLRGYQQLARKVKSLQQQSNGYMNMLLQQLQLPLARRPGLPGLDLRAWLRLGKKIMQIPAVALERIVSLYKMIVNNVTGIPIWQILLGLLATFVWFGIGLKLRHFLQSVDITHLRQQGHGFFSAQIFIVMLQLLNRHAPAILFMIAMFSLLSWFGIPYKAYVLFANIAISLLVFSLLIQLIHVLLLSNNTGASEHGVKFYYSLKLTLLLGEIITILSLLIHHLATSHDIRDLFSRLFMLFLLIIAAVLMKNWSVIPTLLAPYLEGKHIYLKQGIHWLNFLLPFSLFSNALLGLIGYIDLAWTIAVYQGASLLALTVYLLIRGLIDELVRWLSEQCIRRLRNGWLWSQALLRPLHQILKLATLLGTVMSLLLVYNRSGHHAIFNIDFGRLSTAKLFVIAGSTVTVLTVIELTIAGTILVWLSRWSREFAYRWLFANTRDLGLRNSFAIFTQYATIAIGIIIALDVAGLTLSALSLILSAFALGIGFGLRDLFNNFVTGILLLLERPVKIGDWITIGTYEGQVTHIGARSITVNTEDHQELVVPNADLFSKHFINWTHHDSVVRVLVPLRLNRSDQPARVRQITLEVVATIPKILSNPPPEVYFKDVDQILLQFLIEYYVDLKYIVSRSEVRSQFLFALWERFHQEGILPPDVVHDLHVTYEPSVIPA